MSTSRDDATQTVVDTLKQARSVVVLTGAGVSAESGVPTFRDAQTGLWAHHKAEDIATPEAFASDPLFAWNWYRWRRSLVAQAEPNAGHYALAQMATLVPNLTLITQNVDGLHAAAGSESVIEFHGNLFDDRCDSCGVRSRATQHEPLDAPPTCNRCGVILRPGVVLFGELIPESLLRRSTQAAQHCDVFLSVGTSSLVYPAASLAKTALSAGASVVEINMEPTPLSGVADAAIYAPSASVLPALVAALQ
ncbi:MAG: NAD-dependent deacylase [Pseudomonadota bacterium]